MVLGSYRLFSTSFKYDLETFDTSASCCWVIFLEFLISFIRGPILFLIIKGYTSFLSSIIDREKVFKNNNKKDADVLITIEELAIKTVNRYLWMKKVDGVDLMNHCAKCLIGEYEERIAATQDYYEDLRLDDGIYYLCGVAIPFIWENNLHLAFRYKEGSHVSLDNDFYKVEINNAEQIEISNEFIDYSLKKAKFKKYNTCRNWWFANWYNQHIH